MARKGTSTASEVAVSAVRALPARIRLRDCDNPDAKPSSCLVENINSSSKTHSLHVASCGSTSQTLEPSLEVDGREQDGIPWSRQSADMDCHPLHRSFRLSSRLGVRFTSSSCLNDSNCLEYVWIDTAFDLCIDCRLGLDLEPLEMLKVFFRRHFRGLFA